MTPQERQLLNELFERLASLENAPRDPDAVDAINHGLERAPNALYPLVQTVLVQDEALKRADARIRELESELGVQPETGGQKAGFLDNMRETLLGGRERQGSVPSVRPDAPAQPASKWGSGQTLPPGYRPMEQGGQAQPGYGQPPEFGGGGGSFLGTAAATAAGVIGGAMLMNSMRGLFGGQQGQGKGQSAFDPGGQGSAPWNPGSGGDLASQAGLDDIGRGGRSASASDDSGSQRAGLFDVAAQNDSESDDSEYEDDDSDDFGDDTDTA
jgi:uncharacterized protein